MNHPGRLCVCLMMVIAVGLAGCSPGGRGSGEGSPQATTQQPDVDHHHHHFDRDDTEPPSSPVPTGQGPVSTPASPAVVPPPSPVRRRLSHVVVVVMENREYGDVIGSASAPYINSLARRYALATDYFAVGHPSLPNYLALVGGSTFGISSDCTSCSVAGPSLANQLTSAGIPWRAYLEAMPAACFQGSTAGTYAKKHNPFIYFDQVASNPALCAHLVPLGSLSADIQAGGLPSFAWITPDLCNDMHDCPLSTGDNYLSHLLPPLLQALGPDGVLFLTWDEGKSDQGCCAQAAGGHVVTIVAGSGARPGTTSATPYDHYSLLRTVEDAFGLPRLGQAACSCTAAMDDLLAGP